LGTKTGLSNKARRIKTMQRVIFRAEIFKEDDLYVAVCPELNVSSFGENIEDARRSVREAVEAFLEECERMDTLDEVLEESGFVLKEGEWVSRQPVSEERLVVSAH
jgi:predicted RNase H-like HicB family nuclease